MILAHQRLLAVAAAALVMGPAIVAQPTVFKRSIDELCIVGGGSSNPPWCSTNTAVCNHLRNCLQPTVAGPFLEVEVNPTTGDHRAFFAFDIIAPWNNWAWPNNNPNGVSKATWQFTPFAANHCPGLAAAVGQHFDSDHYITGVPSSNVACSASSSVNDGPWYLQVGSCQQPCCLFGCPSCNPSCVCGGGPTWRYVDIPQQTITPQLVGCDRPPAKTCKSNGGTCCAAGGAPTIGGSRGSGGGSLKGTVGGPYAAIGAFVEPEMGAPGVVGLSYLAGGAGRPGFPGTPAWSARLGQGWAHTFAIRIVPDPDEARVWLISADATFTEFTDLSSGTYLTALPSDEKRTLEWLGAGLGWQLLGLDGSVIEFRPDGQWLRTTDRNGNVTEATYDAGSWLESVDLPDQRRIDFRYHGSGKLAEIDEVGIDDTTTRTWGYTWVADQLVRIDRPDGSAWELEYSVDILPLLIRQRLLPAGGGAARVERAWEYSSDRILTKTWRGAETFAHANAVEQYQFAHPTEGETVVTDPYGRDSFYFWDRGDESGAPRILSLEADCPTCGAGPETSWEYDDPNNPLQPTAKIDARNVRTEWTYDAFGMPTLRREATATALERETSFEYSVDFPAFLVEVTKPAADTTCGPVTVETRSIDPSNGDLLARTFDGCEGGVPFSLQTDFGHATSGLTTTIDPPGFGTADEVTFTTDPTRGDLLLATRTDPDPAAAGGAVTTTFHYDAFNRRIGVTDPNGLTTETQYDALNRILRTIIREGILGNDFEFGDLPAGGDLLTEHILDGFGDLTRTVLPRENAIDYGRDHVGRVTSVARKPSAGGQALERTLFTLDDFGHRTAERLERWTGSAWSEQSATDYEYSSQCHLDAIIHDPATAAEVTEYAYDCSGNVERIWDENHPQDSEPLEFTEYAYDELDRLASVTQPWGGSGTTEVETVYGYDVQDNLTSVTDGEGNQTTYIYSDRGLLTEEASPVSGTSTHEYNEHGELVSSTDARGVTTTRTVDAADRLTLVEYSGAAGLDVAFTYGDDDMANEVGRLIGITRHGATINFEYDRFGRTTRDGALVFEYDDNGNRTTITYPDGLTVAYTFDHADREDSLTADPGGESLSVVSAASYLPAGPLSGLTFGNGRSEVRAFTGRYFPERITLEPTGGGSPLLDWEYTTDAVGNPTQIDDLVGSPDRAYTYQDHQYILTGASGPWPGPLEWTYDRIGNRITEDRNSVVDTYNYAGSPGNTALLETVTLGVGGTRTYEYTAAGHVLEVDAGANVVDFLVDEEGRLGGLERVAGDAGSSMLYDGRGFLARVEGFELSVIFRDGFERETTECWSEEVPGPAPSPSSPCSSAFRIVEPIYDSAGLLHALGITETLLGSSTERVLYLAGRPVAIARGHVGALDLLYLTTDHIGTPIAACDDTGALQWSGGFEPFGTDWLSGTSGGASESGVRLRLLGQWADSAWTGALDFSYNLLRWYDQRGGRYGAPDPLGLYGPDADRLSHYNLFAFAASQPTVASDPTGLVSVPFDSGFPERCRRRIQKRVLPKLDRIIRKPDCSGFFCEKFGVNLKTLAAGSSPFLFSNSRARGGSYNCGIAPFQIGLNPDFACRASSSDVARAIVHELAHFADCTFNGDRFSRPPLNIEEGCEAEIACYGNSIGLNCKNLGYKYRDDR